MPNLRPSVEALNVVQDFGCCGFELNGGFGRREGVVNLRDSCFSDPEQLFLPPFFFGQTKYSLDPGVYNQSHESTPKAGAIFGEEVFDGFPIPDSYRRAER